MENNQSFYSIAEFFVRFTMFGGRKDSLKWKNPCFLAPNWSKRISLQDFPHIPVYTVLYRDRDQK